MRVAILTFPRTYNHGATLQCYALSKYVESLGNESVIINIPLKSTDVHQKKNRSLQYIIKQFPRYIFNKIKVFVRSNIIKDSIYYQTPLTTEQKKILLDADRENMKLFDLFRSAYFKNFTEEYITEDDFLKAYPEADAYIVGSDQVWNLEITRTQYPIFFFSFVKGNAKIISYAASIGGNVNFQYTDAQYENIARLLSRFNAISVRDSSSSIILKEKFKINPVEVLDPTFLVPKQLYFDIAKVSSLDTSGHIYCFKFIINKHWEKVIDKLSSNLGLPVRMDNNVIPTNKYEYKPVCDVPDWLRLIQTSDFIMTDSFHCMVFCILFKKEFIILPSYRGGEGRMVDLARKLGLDDRYFASPESFLKDTRDWKKEHIDYNNVYRLLVPMIDYSQGFLKQHLQ